MSFDRVEHMRRSVEDRWNRGDVAGFMAAFAADAELQPDATFPGGGATIRGKEKIQGFFEGIHRPVELGQIEVVGDEVMCSFRWAGGPAEAGYDWTFLYRFCGDQIVRARYYADPEHARQAAARSRQGDATWNSDS
ncbi:MAG: nuclear transport factor 2 family protein [Acidimicrobiia bacterium]